MEEKISREKIGSVIVICIFFFSAVYLSIHLTEKEVNADTTINVQVGSVTQEKPKGILSNLTKKFGTLFTTSTVQNQTINIINTSTNTGTVIISGSLLSDMTKVVYGVMTTGSQSGINTQNLSIASYTLTLENMRSNTCNGGYFDDISQSPFVNEIVYAHSTCIVRGQGIKYFPNNYVRIGDFLTMIVRAYSDMFATGEQITVFDIPRINNNETMTKILAYAEYMKILKFFRNSQNELKLDTFVSQGDVIRTINILSIIKPQIATSGLTLLDEPNKIIKRGELAYVISQSLDQYQKTNISEFLMQYNKNKPTQQQTTTDTTPRPIATQATQPSQVVQENTQLNTNLQPTTNIQTGIIQTGTIRTIGLDQLIAKGFIPANTKLLAQARQPITRYDFLELLLRIKHTQNTSIPLQVPNLFYFEDVNEGTGMSSITQAKNIGLTAFFEINKRGKQYLEPSTYVTQYEASIIINDTFKSQLAATKQMDSVLVQTDTLAQMIVVALGLQLPPKYNEDRVNVEDLRKNVVDTSLQLFNYR